MSLILIKKLTHIINTIIEIFHGYKISLSCGYRQADASRTTHFNENKFMPNTQNCPPINEFLVDGDIEVVEIMRK